MLPCHEILTSTGWKFFKDLTMKDKLATLRYNKLNYEFPIKLVPSYYSGKMYQIKNHRIDLTVRRDHNMYVSEGTTKSFPATLPKQDTYRLTSASDLIGEKVKYKTSAIWEAEDVEKFILPTVVVDSVSYGERKIDMSAWLRLFGFWISGHCFGKKYYRTTICCKKGKWEVINSARILGLIHNEGKCGIDIYNEQLFSYLYYLPQGLPDWIWTLSADQCKLLLECILSQQLLSSKDIKQEKSRFTYRTSSKKLADDIMRLCIHSGYSGYYNDSKIIIIKKDCVELGNCSLERIYEYNGELVHVLMDTGVLYVKRNGKGSWVGS
jgi:hypothetical protein